VTLTADTASERAALPKASSLGDCLLLADRGYFDRDYLTTSLHAPSTTSPGTHDAHILNGIDNVGDRNSLWSRFLRLLNYITYVGELKSRMIAHVTRFSRGGAPYIGCFPAVPPYAP
jgi:hypothetical protein